MEDTKKVMAATAGVVAATGLAVAAKAAIDRAKNGRAKNGQKTTSVNGTGESTNARTYHLVPDEKGWAVRAESSERATSTHETKKEAVRAARDLASRRAPSRLVIHRADGSIQRHHSYTNE